MKILKKGGKSKGGGYSNLDAAQKKGNKRGLAAYMSYGNRPKETQSAGDMDRVKSASGSKE